MSNDPLKIERNGRPIDLAGLWAPNPALLVCSGPSLARHDLNRLRERGVASLGVNNAAAFAPVKAWCFSDPQTKFHQGLFLDPSVLTFAPAPKLKRRFVAKTGRGFQVTSIRVRDCPNTCGFYRQSCFVPETFFDDWYAHWGRGKAQPEDADENIPGGLCTVFLGFRLLVYLGVRRVFLLGVDHRKREDGYAYGYPSRKKGRKGFRKERRMWELLRPECERRGIEVFDCGGINDFFPSVTFDEAIWQCKGSVPEEPFDTIGWYEKARIEEECKRNETFEPLWYGRNVA